MVTIQYPESAVMLTTARTDRYQRSVDATAATAATAVSLPTNVDSRRAPE